MNVDQLTVRRLKAALDFVAAGRVELVSTEPWRHLEAMRIASENYLALLEGDETVIENIAYLIYRDDWIANGEPWSINRERYLAAARAVLAAITGRGRAKIHRGVVSEDFS